MGVLPVAVEGAGDLREPLLMLGWLPFGEMMGLEVLRLKMPILTVDGGEREERSRRRSHTGGRAEMG